MVSGRGHRKVILKGAITIFLNIGFRKNYKKLFELHEASNTQFKLDAVINHLLRIQTLHKHSAQNDVPQYAQMRAAELGWQAY